MPDIGIMETAARARVAASADCNRVRTSLSRPWRAMSHCPRRSSHPPPVFRRSSSGLSHISAAATFVDLLFIAGLCKTHSPRYRSFRSTTRCASSTAAAPASPQDTARSTAHILPQLSGSKSNEEKPCDQSKAKERIGAQLEGQPNLPAIEPKQAPLRRVPPYDSTRKKMPDFGGGGKMRRENLITLFKFYAEVLGHEEATKSLDLVMSDPERQLNARPPRENDSSVGDDVTKPGVALLVSLLSDKHSANETVFYAYTQVPSPGVSYLSEQSRRLLLHRFAVPPRLRRDHAIRYLTIIDDMCNASLYISPYCWNTAIHLAGKCARTVTDHHVSRALDVWSRMENEGETRSCSGVFNTLFDIVIKAGQFRVADKLVDEMKRRGVDFSRFGRVARIYYRGIQQDVEGVRQAYREFVRAGEVVDTVVLNCVLVSLIRSGRFDLAEQMYERMGDVRIALSKSSDDEKRLTYFYPQPHDNYAAYRKASKKLGNLLGMAATLHDKLPDNHRALQSALPLTPDGKTFHILLSYHALESGDLERFLARLRDMEVHFSIPPQGMVYVLLFQGFAIHGRKPKTAWTLKRLHGVWEAFLRAVDNSDAAIKQKNIEKRITEFEWENPLTGEKKTVANPDLSENSGVEDAESAFSPANEYRDRDDDDDWRYENTVFLGRKMIVSSLNAFFVCGGRQAALELWADVQSRWRRKRQSPPDVAYVRRVLTRLLS